MIDETVKMMIYPRNYIRSVKLYLLVCKRTVDLFYSESLKYLVLTE